MVVSKQGRASAISKKETIAYRNKTIVVTYDYWFEKERLRLDDVLAKLVDAFFLSEDTIYYKILKETKLTDEDRRTIKPLIRQR